MISSSPNFVVETQGGDVQFNRRGQVELELIGWALLGPMGFIPNPWMEPLCE